jgi:hypothetical protein
MGGGIEVLLRLWDSVASIERYRSKVSSAHPAGIIFL